MSIQLHPTLGVNPRLVELHCKLCGETKTDSLVLLGAANHRDKCPSCGVWVFGHRYRDACPACEGGRLDHWERQPLDDHEQIHTNGVCQECRGWMEKGVIFIEILGEPGQKYREWDCYCGHHYAALVEMEKPGLDLHSFTGEKTAFCPKCGQKPNIGSPHKTIEEANPYRTGGFCVIKDEAVKRMGIKPPELEAHILKARATFLPTAVWNLLGLPRENIPAKKEAENSGSEQPAETPAPDEEKKPKDPETPESCDGTPV